MKDACKVCFGANGGTPGNENVIEGVVICDYCHSAISPILEPLRAKLAAAENASALATLEGIRQVEKYLALEKRCMDAEDCNAATDGDLCGKCQRCWRDGFDAMERRCAQAEELAVPLTDEELRLMREQGDKLAHEHNGICSWRALADRLAKALKHWRDHEDCDDPEVTEKPLAAYDAARSEATDG